MAIDRRIRSPQALPPAAELAQDERLLRVHERPDGYHWTDVGQRQEFGPYESLEEALAAMDDSQQGLEQAIEQTELTEQAEQGLDIETKVDRGDEDEPESFT